MYGIMRRRNPGGREKIRRTTGEGGAVVCRWRCSCAGHRPRETVTVTTTTVAGKRTAATFKNIYV